MLAKMLISILALAPHIADDIVSVIDEIKSADPTNKQVSTIAKNAADVAATIAKAVE